MSSTDETNPGQSAGSNDEPPGEIQPPTEEAMSEPVGGPFTGSAQPIGHPGVEEGAATGSDGAAPAESEPQEQPEASAASGATHEMEGGYETPRRVEVDHAEGSLTIVGGADQVVVSAQHWHEQIEATELADGMRFSRLPGATELRVPDGVTVLVREVDGDLRCERLNGSLRVNRVQRDARIEDVSSAQISWVAGDLNVERAGTLEVESVGGDTWIDGLRDYVMLGRIGSDLEARRLGALTVTEAVGGDAQVERCDAVTFDGPVGGDAEFRRISGKLRLTAVGGDLELNDVSEVTAGTVAGDLEVEGVAGLVTCNSVGGDAELANTFGPVSIGVIGGDFKAERAPGGVSVARVGGDAELDTLLRPESKYTINAGGDVDLRVRGEVNARFVAQSFGGEIRTRLPLTVERGRRRNLVGALGTGAATVTLQSGGDITIVAADEDRGVVRMSDEYGKGDDRDDAEERGRTFEGNVAGRKFRVRVENGPNRAGFTFKGPFTPEEEERAREFNFEWERGRGAHASGEYGEQLNEFRDRAEQLARRAGEEARKYAESAAKRARETDWDAVGREVRGTIERAMADLEEAFGRVRREWEPRAGGGASSDAGARPSGGPQRVRIEHDEPVEESWGASSAEAAGQAQDPDAVRRQVLEELRNGRISLDEAERRLNNIR